MPRVSIIIPVFNVDRYLNRCVDSVLAQSLRDIEVILVDDGSTDSSTEICEQYKMADSRVKVIHKPNQGLSCARNDGIDTSTAPYLMFVDGDDWVAPEFCEKPYTAAMVNNADLVIFRAYTVYNGKIIERRKRISEGIVDLETALSFGENSAWNKLYHRRLFENIRYPEGKVFEDIFVTHKIVCNATRIVMLSDVLYYWLYRIDSLSHTPSAIYRRDGLIAALQKAEDLKDFGCSPETYMTTLCDRSLSILANENPSNDPYLVKAEEVLNSIKGIPPGLNWKKKAMLVVWKLNKRLFHFICSVTGQKDNS